MMDSIDILQESVRHLEEENRRLRLITNTPNYAALTEENERLRANMGLGETIPHCSDCGVLLHCEGSQREHEWEWHRRYKEAEARIEAALAIEPFERWQDCTGLLDDELVEAEGIAGQTLPAR